MATTAAFAGSSEQRDYEFLRPIVKGWIGCIQQAYATRKPFDTVAWQCLSFVNGSQGFMWDPKFMGTFVKGNYSPTFKMNLNKAFEFIAIYGPYLYAQNPVRSVNMRRELEVPNPEDFQNQPGGQQVLQAIEQNNQQLAMKDGIMSMLMKAWLNYTPDEMPNGGLAEHAQMAITEALLTGQGVVWPEPYQFPDSNRTITGCFFDNESNLLLDPDASTELDAKWCARMVREPYWKAERRFKLPKDSLKRAATLESHNGHGVGTYADRWYAARQNNNEQNDLITYYHVYSKKGIGWRNTGMSDELGTKLDESLGDYCHLVVCENVEWPLNAPSRLVRSMSDTGLKQLFRWPIPWHKDDRWPFCRLQFYRHPKCIWPIAPLSPGLGELIYLNVFYSHLAGRIWSSSRDFIAVLDSAAAFVEPALKGGSDQIIMKLPNVMDDVNKIVKFLQQPETNPDAWRIIDAISASFEMRVGLTPLMYGVSRTQNRTATETEAKSDAAKIRPQYMADKVEAWAKQMADMEKFAAYYHVEGRDVVHVLGPVGASLWESNITNEDEDVMLREVRATVEAGTARRRNKATDAQNMNQVLNVVMPEASKHADVTGDTNPLNAIIKQWGDAIDQETDDMMMGPRQPQQQEPTPEQQQAAQLELFNLQADAQKKQADAQRAQADAQLKQVQAQQTAGEGAMEASKKQLELQYNQAKGAQELQQIAERFAVQSEMDTYKHLMELDQSQDKHDQELRQDEETHEQDMEQADEQARIKAQQARQQSNGRQPAGAPS